MTTAGMAVLLALMWLAAACGGSDGDSAADVETQVAESPSPAETIEPTSEDPPTSEATIEGENEETSAATSDPDGSDRDTAEAAQSLVALAASAGDRIITEGGWFTPGFTNGLAFDLPVDGRLIEHGIGSVTIEIGQPGTADHSVIRILEAVALSSPGGPIPIGVVGPDLELASTTTLGQGEGESAHGPFTWRDLRVESTRIPEGFQLPCPIEPSIVCSQGVITEGGEINIELDVPLRFAAREWGNRQLFVVAVALDPASREAGSHDAFELALEIAGSAHNSDQTDDTERRPLGLISARSETIPAGSWFSRLNGVTVDFDVPDDIEGLWLLRREPNHISFQRPAGDGTYDLFFSIQVFPGFVDGLQNDVDAVLPLSREAFVEGVEALVGVERRGQAEIGGLPSTWIDTGLGFPDSPFACDAAQRPPDLGPDDTCTKFTNGFIFVEGPDRPKYRNFYIEEIGVSVGIPGTRDGADFTPDPIFEDLFASMRLTPTELRPSAPPSDPAPTNGAAIGEVLEPGRVGVDMLGTSLSFEADIPVEIPVAGDGALVISEPGPVDATGPDLVLLRPSGFATGAETGTPPPPARFTGDLDAWLGNEAVVVSDDRDAEVGGRDARVVDFTVVAPEPALDRCGEPPQDRCIFFASTLDPGPLAHTVARTGRNFRLWVIDQDEHPDIIVLAGAGQDVEGWIGGVADRLVESIELGPPAPAPGSPLTDAPWEDGRDGLVPAGDRWLPILGGVMLTLPEDLEVIQGGQCAVFLVGPGGSTGGVVIAKISQTGSGEPVDNIDAFEAIDLGRIERQPTGRTRAVFGTTLTESSFELTGPPTGAAASCAPPGEPTAGALQVGPRRFGAEWVGEADDGVYLLAFATDDPDNVPELRALLDALADSLVMPTP
ncbi:MAG: hypothetical protein AAF567_02250 [Actinomycetota bacterium]